MIPVQHLITEFDLKFDRFKSDYKDNLRTEHKLMVLNEAQDIYFENRVQVAETDSLVRNDLRAFEVKEKELSRIESTKNFDLFRFPSNMYKMLRQKAVVGKDCCPDKKTLSISIAQTDDLNLSFNNPFWEASFEWEHLMGDEGDKGLYVFHQSNLDIFSVTIDYYRKPKVIHGASMFKDGYYIDWTGQTISFDRGSEFSDTYAYRKIIDLAVLIARSNVGDSRDFQLKKDEILSKR